MDDTNEIMNSDEDWISAGEALDVVSQRNGAGDAHEAIARRAHLGGLRSKAALFVWEEKTARISKEPLRDTDTELPHRFWWAEGAAALDTQDWAAGDFSTWIDGKYRWQAFGVKFDRAGIEAMLAPLSVFPNQEPITSGDGLATATVSVVTPSDEEIKDKMLELYEFGVSRDNAAKLIRQIAGFETVGNEHARRASHGYLPKGRPKNRQQK